MQRRTFLEACLASPLILSVPRGAEAAEPLTASPNPELPMHGLISQLQATPGDRDALIAILLEGTKGLPGCKLYAIAADTADETGVWINEVWESEAAHAASLKLPAVQQAIAAGKPMIAGFGARHVVTPHGLGRELDQPRIP